PRSVSGNSVRSFLLVFLVGCLFLRLGGGIGNGLLFSRFVGEVSASFPRSCRGYGRCRGSAGLLLLGVIRVCVLVGVYRAGSFFLILVQGLIAVHCVPL